MKLKYYGIRIGLIIAISCITLTFINFNNSNSNSNSNNKNIQSSLLNKNNDSKSLEPLPIPDTKKDVWNVEELPNASTNSSTIIEDLN